MKIAKLYCSLLHCTKLQQANYLNWNLNTSGSGLSYVESPRENVFLVSNMKESEQKILMQIKRSMGLGKKSKRNI